MEPIYRNIEFCRDAKTLWGKLREGRWDWLGVHPNGQFVLGSPPSSRLTDHVAATLTTGGAREGDHGVVVDTDPKEQNLASYQWLDDESTSRARYAEIVADYESREGPLLVRIQRVEQRQVAEEQFIVKRPPTYGTWRPPPGA